MPSEILQLPLHPHLLPREGGGSAGPRAISTVAPMNVKLVGY